MQWNRITNRGVIILGLDHDKELDFKSHLAIPTRDSDLVKSGIVTPLA